MKEKTILLVTSHASRGGIINYMDILTKRLERAGYAVQTVAFYRGDNDDPLPNITILDEGRTLGKLGYMRAIAKFFALCLKARPSVILGCMPFANIMGGLASAVSGARSIATHHNPVESQNSRLQAIDTRIGVRGLYSTIVSVSDAVAQSFASHPEAYRKHMCVIRNGIPAITPAREATAVRSSLGVAPGEILMLMAGRLAPQKNVVGAVSAMAETNGLKLFLTGDGPQRPELETIISSGQLQDKVKLLGVLEKQQLVDLIFAADAFVQVSAYEGHSAALLEAIYAHLPLVVSDVPTQVEAVTSPDGTVAAMLCDPNDHSDIARAMQSVADDENCRIRLKTASEVLSRSLRTEEDVLDDYANLFDRLAS